MVHIFFKGGYELHVAGCAGGIAVVPSPPDSVKASPVPGNFDAQIKIATETLLTYMVDANVWNRKR